MSSDAFVENKIVNGKQRTAMGYLSRLRRLPKRAMVAIPDAFWGAWRLNGHVYNACLAHRMKWPDIPARPAEHYGQCGEDLIVVALLEAMAARNGHPLRQQTYLEIGGNHPFATSATYLLHKKLDMVGLIIEANAELIPELLRGRSKDKIVYGAVQDQDIETVNFWISKLSEISSLDSSFVSRWGGGIAADAKAVNVPALRVNKVIKDHLDDRAPCFMSIDVEGLDLAILRDFDFVHYRPWLIQIEASDDYIDGNTNDIMQHMSYVNYELVAKTEVNLIFSNSEMS